jgi:hypothetical protein
VGALHASESKSEAASESSAATTVAMHLSIPCLSSYRRDETAAAPSQFRREVGREPQRIAHFLWASCKVQGSGQVRNSHRAHYQLEDSNAPEAFSATTIAKLTTNFFNLFILRFNFVRNLFSTRQRFPSKYTKFSITHPDKQTKHIQPNLLSATVCQRS